MQIKDLEEAEVKSPNRIGIFDSKLKVEKRDAGLALERDGGGRTVRGRAAELWQEKRLRERRGWSFALRDSA